MGKITRICTHCHKSGELDALYCQHCGHEINAELFTTNETSLSKSVMNAASKAAVPILVGAASLLARTAWKTLRNHMENASYPTTLPQMTPPESFIQTQTPSVQTARTPDNTTSQPPAHTHGCTIHIRSQWVVGDANGIWQQGASEHTIELE